MLLQRKLLLGFSQAVLESVLGNCKKVHCTSRLVLFLWLFLVIWHVKVGLWLDRTLDWTWCIAMKMSQAQLVQMCHRVLWKRWLRTVQSNLDTEIVKLKSSSGWSLKCEWDIANLHETNSNQFLWWQTREHTVEVAEIANLGLVFLLFMIGWETQFFEVGSMVTTICNIATLQKLYEFKAWSWMCTRFFALLGRTWQPHWNHHFFHHWNHHPSHFFRRYISLCRRKISKKLVDSSDWLRWDEWFCSRDSSNFLSALEQGASVFFLRTDLYRCNKKVNTKTNEKMSDKQKWLASTKD